VLEYVVDTVKRLTRHTIHCTGGKKLEGVTGIIKSLGLLGEWATDKLHGMKEMTGMWADGDWRRMIAIDATGMNAANFSTFSLGIAAYGNTMTYKYLYDNPQEYYRMEKLGLIPMLPKSKPDQKLDKPAYVVDVKYTMSASMIMDSFCPHFGQKQTQGGMYKYMLYHKVHSVDKFLSEVIEDWDKYQKMLKEVQGCDREYIKYPYSKEMIQEFMDDYNARVGLDINIAGPPPEAEERMYADAKAGFKASYMGGATTSMQALLHKDLDDANAAISGWRNHLALDEVVASKQGSAQLFDLEKYDAWSDWTSGSAEVRTYSSAKAALMDDKVQESLFDFLKKFQAPKPRNI